MSGALKHICAATALGLVLAPAHVLSADWSFEPRASVGANWTDNISLAPDGAEESDVIAEVKPGFSLGLQGARAQADLSYDLQALWFNDNSDLDDIYHQARGSGKIELVPTSLFLDGFLRYDQQNVDFGGRVDYSNLFRTDNRTDAFVFGLSPYHVGRWGNWGQSLVRYNYQGVRYTNTDDGVTSDLQDSDSQFWSASLGSPEEKRGVSWRASGSATRTEFETAREFEYRRVALDLGVPVGLRTRATATLGRESDVAADPGTGGLDENFWFVGVEWRPSDLQTFSARVGERYFGRAFGLSWTRRGSRGDLAVQYNEDPTTANGTLGDDNVFLPGFRPGGSPQLDTRVYLRKRLSARATYELARSTLAARAYGERRDYGDAGGEEEVYGLTLTYDWDVAQRTRLGATIDWEQRDYASARSDDLGGVSLRVSRTLTRTFSAILRGSHYFRNSNDPASEYDVNQVSLSIRGQF